MLDKFGNELNVGDLVVFAHSMTNGYLHIGVIERTTRINLVIRVIYETPVFKDGKWEYNSAGEYKRLIPIIHTGLYLVKYAPVMPTLGGS